MTDDSRVVRAGFDAVMEAAGQARNTARTARHELETGGRLASRRGDGRGNLTAWTVLCLPETSPLPNVGKGVNNVDPLSAPRPAPKGGQPSSERGATRPEKGGQAQHTDQPKPDRGLNRLAKPSSSPVAAALIRSAFADVTDDEIETIISERTARGARQPFLVIRHELGNGMLRLPCDRTGPRSHTEACRSGDSGRCGRGWCECRCHVRPIAAQRVQTDAPPAFSDR